MAKMNLSVVVLASAALLLAGCGGGSSSPGVAHLSNTSGDSSANTGGKSSTPESSASAQQKMVAYSRCMRTHGVPEFPEPSEGKLLVRSSVHNGHVTGFNPESAQFQAAQKACKSLAPPRLAPSPALQAKMQEGALKFSQCMRTHGVPNFPDPQFGPGGRVSLQVKGGPGGIDPRSSQFQAAQKTCQSDLPRPPGAKGGPGGGPISGGPGVESRGQAVAVP
jgi:hypothetical protein